MQGLADEYLRRAFGLEPDSPIPPVSIFSLIFGSLFQFSTESDSKLTAVCTPLSIMFVSDSFLGVESVFLFNHWELF